MVTSRSGTILAGAVDLDLCVLNNGDATAYHASIKSVSIFDLSMCSPDAPFNFHWRVAEDLCWSNHYPIVVFSPEAVSSLRVPHWREDREEWNSFHSLSRVNCKTKEFEGLEEAIDYFTILLLSSGEQSIPQTSGTLNSHLVP